MWMGYGWSTDNKSFEVLIKKSLQFFDEISIYTQYFFGLKEAEPV